MKLFAVLSLAAVICLAKGQTTCFPPYQKVGNLCLYVEATEQLSWAEARDYCGALAGDGSNGDLMVTPSCDDFTLLARYMELNHHGDEHYWMGATRIFGESWTWLNLDPLRTGVPFFSWDEGEMPGDDCAALSGAHDFKMECSTCDTPRPFVCGVPMTAEKEVPEPRPGPVECGKDDSFIINGVCYVFKREAETWERAEEKCREEHKDQNGELFYPQGCEEYTYMAHHLEAEEITGDYWVGAIDTTGNHAWTWNVGTSLMNGVPFWAYGEPNHESDGNPRAHCGLMASQQRYYMVDENCHNKHMYICKVDNYVP